MKVLKFEKYIEYITLNEAVSKATFSEVKKTLEPFGWKVVWKKSGDEVTISKSGLFGSGVGGHLKHDSHIHTNRTVDINQLDHVRTSLIDEFLTTGDLSTIKAIDWKKWGLYSPLTRELKDYDPETGKKIEKPVEEPELNMGQKLHQAKVEKNINSANELYKDAALWKIDYTDESSVYVIMYIDDEGNKWYNTCKSEDDRRPLLKRWNPTQDNKDWTPYYEEKDGHLLFGKENWKKGTIDKYIVLPDGTLDKTVYISESKEY